MDPPKDDNELLRDKSKDSPESKAARATLVRQMSRQHVLRGVAEKPKEEKKGKPKLAGWKHFLAGGVAGACEVIGTMPLDVAKTQMQINPGKYRNPIDCLSKVYKSNGFPGLYYGMPAFLLQTAGKAAIRFTAFAKTKEAMSAVFGKQAVEQDYEVLSSLVAGFMAGTVEAAAWTTPTERLKVLRQADIGGVGQHKGLLRSGLAVVRTGGIQSLFVGMVPTVIRQASSVGIRFMLYDSVKKGISLISGDKEGGTLTYMAAGGLVGALSVAINNPVDVIKNIAQSGKSKGTIHIAKQIYAENGVPGFFRGLTARVPRVFFGQAITFAAYEQMAALLLKI